MSCIGRAFDFILKEVHLANSIFWHVDLPSIECKIRSGEGLMLETSALESLYGG